MNFEIKNVTANTEATRGLNTQLKGLALIASEMILAKKYSHTENSHCGKFKKEFFDCGKYISFEITEISTGHSLIGEMYPY